MNRDNHAGKLITLGWIVGLFEGEGYIGLWKRTDKRQPHYKDTYRPSCVIANTDERAMLYLSEKLSDFGVVHLLKVHKGKGKWRPYWTVEISGFGRLKTFIDSVEEHLVIKKEQVALVKEFIERRSKLYKNVPYTARDHEVYEELKRLKRN